MSEIDEKMAEWRRTLWGTGPCPDSSQENLTLTDAERECLRVWLAECLRQASTATEGCNEELAERWQERAKRAAAMIERLGGWR